MFPFFGSTFARARTAVARNADTPRFRAAVAAMLVFFHVLAFAKAGRDRLDLPFNSKPDNTPYYSNPDAPSVGNSYPRQPHYWSRLIVSRWDAQHHIGFAIRGLTSCPSDPDGINPATHKPVQDVDYAFCGVQWFPGWGLAGGLVADVTHQAPDLVLMLMSCLCAFVINLLWTSRAITKRLGLREAWAAMLAFNLFPSGFYVVTPYAEAATMMFVLVGAWCLLEERWLLGALAIGAATGMRVAAFVYAVAFGVVALTAAWRAYRAKTPRWWRPLAAAPLAGWGALVTMIGFRLSIGLWFPASRVGAVLDREAVLMGRPPDSTRVFDVTYYVKGFGSQHHDIVILVGVIAICLLCGREVMKRLGDFAGGFVAIASALAVFVAAYASARAELYWGMNRYLLLAPLTFLAAGVMARKHGALFVLWLVLCFAFYWHVELCSYITQGRPDLCPCLGKFEFAAPFQS